MTPIWRPGWWDRLDPAMRRRVVYVGLLALIVLIVILTFVLTGAPTCHHCT